MLPLATAGSTGVLSGNTTTLLLHPCRSEDEVVLGVHDLRFSSSQTILVDEVFGLPQDGNYPPRSDLALLRLSVPARLSRSC